MSIDEPQFNYAGGKLDDPETLQRRAQESAMRQALASEAKAHVWEHKQSDPRLGQAMGRTFTREEVFFCAGAAAMAAREGLDLVAAVNRAIAHLDGGK